MKTKRKTLERRFLDSIARGAGFTNTQDYIDFFLGKKPKNGPQR